jgi:hypothetical protein
MRQLRRLAERGTELAELRRVEPRDWARLERLVPDDERRGALAPARVVGRPGAEVAALVEEAATRAMDRLRGEAGARLR